MIYSFVAYPVPQLTTQWLISYSSDFSITIMHFVNNDFVVRSFLEVTKFSPATDLPRKHSISPNIKVKIRNFLILQTPSVCTHGIFIKRVTFHIYMINIDGIILECSSPAKTLKIDVFTKATCWYILLSVFTRNVSVH